MRGGRAGLCIIPPIGHPCMARNCRHRGRLLIKAGGLLGPQLTFELAQRINACSPMAAAVAPKPLLGPGRSASLPASWRSTRRKSAEWHCYVNRLEAELLFPLCIQQTTCHPMLVYTPDSRHGYFSCGHTEVAPRLLGGYRFWLRCTCISSI